MNTLEIPTGDPDAELPPVHVAELDRATLQELFGDVEALGEHLEIVIKRASQGYVDRGLSPSLTDAMTQLVLGTAVGVQLRYRFKGEDWCDTLMRTDGGFRLVRIRPPSSPEESGS